MGAFVVSKRFNEEYKFVFTSRKGKTIFTSMSYELKFECEDDIELFKQNIDKCVFVKQKASGDKYFFRLMLEDNLFAVSRKYSTPLRLQKGIDEINKYASKSETLDFSENEFLFND